MYREFFLFCLQNFKEIGERYKKLLKLEKKGVLGNSLFKYKNLRDLKKNKRKKIVFKSILWWEIWICGWFFSNSEIFLFKEARFGGAKKITLKNWVFLDCTKSYLKIIFLFYILLKRIQR